MKRAQLVSKDLIIFYTTSAHYICFNLCHPCVFNGLLKYLKLEFERIQKRAFSIICPNDAYIKASNEVNIQTFRPYLTIYS